MRMNSSRPPASCLLLSIILTPPAGTFKIKTLSWTHLLYIPVCNYLMFHNEIFVRGIQPYAAGVTSHVQNFFDCGLYDSLNICSARLLSTFIFKIFLFQFQAVCHVSNVASALFCCDGSRGTLLNCAPFLSLFYAKFASKCAVSGTMWAAILVPI